MTSSGLDLERIERGFLNAYVRMERDEKVQIQVFTVPKPIIQGSDIVALQQLALRSLGCKLAGWQHIHGRKYDFCYVTVNVATGSSLMLRFMAQAVPTHFALAYRCDFGSNWRVSRIMVDDIHSKRAQEVCDDYCERYGGRHNVGWLPIYAEKPAS